MHVFKYGSQLKPDNGLGQVELRVRLRVSVPDKSSLLSLEIPLIPSLKTLRLKKDA